MHPTWPLVGRQEELDFLVERLLGGKGASVVIGGAAGVGKTRLAREAATRIEAKGGDVEFVVATAASSALPFGAFARLLTQKDAPGGSAVDIIRAAVHGLGARSQAQPLLVVVDDAQHLDTFSALLVHHLAADRRVGQLLTIRSGTAVPDPLPALWKDGMAARVDVQPLSVDEVALLLPIVLGGAVDPSTADALWRATSGHPLLLHEVVLDALSSGSLSQIHDLWRWMPKQGHGTRLREVVAGRLGELSAEDRACVEMVALSEPLAVSLVRALAPGADLGSLESKTVLRIEPDGLRQEVRLWHPILADVVRGELSLLARAAHAARLADVLRQTGGHRRTDRLRVALLDIDAADHSRPQELALAALEANSLSDHALAERLAHAAYSVTPTASSALALGEALLVQGKLDAADPVLVHALDLADEDATRARLAWDLHQLYQALDRRDDASAALALAGERMLDPAWRQVMEGHRIQQLLVDGHTNLAGEQGEALLASAIDGKVRLRLVTSLVPAWAVAGRTGEALALAASVVPDAFVHQSEMPLGITWAFASRAVALLVAGELVDATSHVGMAKAVGDGLVAGDEWSVLALLEGRLALATGCAGDAASHLRRAAGALRTADGLNHLRWCLASLAEAESLRGDLPAAELAVDEARAIHRRPGTYDTDAERALAWVVALGGEWSRGAERLAEVADLQRAEGQSALEILTRHDAYRLGDHAQAGAILALADVVDGRWAGSVALHVRAAEAAHGGLLEDAAIGFESQGALLLAAEASAEAATVFEGSGLKARATQARRKAHDLITQCGGVRTPLLAEADAPVALTRREHEVVELAAQGLSNAEVAERLFVSVRTAEGHLLRAFAKLGVTDRASLRASR